MQRGKYFALADDQCAICAENASFGLSSLTNAGGSAESNPFSAYLQSAATLPSSSSAQDDAAEHAISGPPKQPITTPYRASCGHVYCYVCLSERLLRAADDGDDGWTCLRCGEIVRNCERVDAIYDGDDTHTSEGWASEVEELGSFESDLGMSVDSVHQR